ncbi:hypothetical protein SAMN05216226_107171 [Halovenus aranensis]|uniref:Uncharacterized protein n=1 Tax=Halovenus aranensis TaxID=890420 RepID=A0A1G8VU38_9EURY|nr:hypothetical protein SAMN05216226_107171 [Halovenus aranensis]
MTNEFKRYGLTKEKTTEVSEHCMLNARRRKREKRNLFHLADNEQRLR